MPKGDNSFGHRKGKRGAELVGRIRGSILNALDAVENRGKVLSQILADKFEQDPIRFMELAAKYCPKDLNVDTTIKDAYTEAYLIIARRINGTERVGLDREEHPALEGPPGTVN